MQIQGAMSLPMRRMPISREGLYSILAFLRRHRAAKSPRAVRFKLERGRPVRSCSSRGNNGLCSTARITTDRSIETIRVWGRDRLHVLARLLPLLDEAEVYLFHGLAELLVNSNGRNAVALGTLRLDRQRLDGCRRARRAHTSG